MLSGLSITRRFAASTALAFSMAGLSPVMANEPPAPTPAVDTPAKAEKPVVNKPLPAIDYEAIMAAPKFKEMQTLIMAESVRSGLTQESLKTEAKKYVTEYVQYMVNNDKPYTAEDLLSVSIQGMFKSLSPHDDFIPAKNQKDFREQMSGSFVGLGIEIDTSDKKIKVIAPIEGSPAERAGFKSGDIVLEVNGKPLEGLETEAAIKLMRGEPGSKADVKLLRDGVVIDVSLIRAPIKQKMVHYRMLDGGIAHIKIRQFTDGVSFGVKQAIAQAKAEAYLDPATQAKGGLKGIVLDFMFDPGGLIEESRAIPDDFIDGDGVIVSSQGRNPEHSERHTANPGHILKNKKIPVVVLINESSASASEIVAGALQDHETAVVMGSDSFGKGTVQTVMGNRDGSATKTTIAIFRRPSGVSNQWIGVKPDILVDPRDQKYADFMKERPTERTLKNSIPNTRDLESQKDKTKFVCAPVRTGITLADAVADKNIFVQKGDFESSGKLKEGTTDEYERTDPFEIGALNPFVECARHYILKQHDPTYQSPYSAITPKPAAPAAKP